MKVLKASQSIFASRPLGTVKTPMKVDKYNKFGYIDTHINASGQNRIISNPTLPIVPPININPPINTTTGSVQQGTANVSPTQGGQNIAPVSETSNQIPSSGVGSSGAGSESKNDNIVVSSECYVSYIISGIIGGGIGYVIAEKGNKDIYGGILFGAGALSGLTYLYCHKDEIMNKYFNKEKGR